MAYAVQNLICYKTPTSWFLLKLILNPIAFLLPMVLWGNEAIAHPAMIQVQAPSYAMIIAPPLGWSGPDSFVRMARLSNGDGLIVRCRTKARRGCFSRKQDRNSQIQLFSTGRLVKTRNTLEEVVNGGAEISLDGRTTGTTLGQPDYLTMVRLSTGEEVVAGSLFDKKRYPGCIGGVAPEQMWIDERPFAFFYLGKEARSIEVSSLCKLAEKRRKITTHVYQVVPNTFYWYQAPNGLVYMPVLENSILVFDPKRLDSGQVGGSTFYVLNMKQWPESEWKALPTFLEWNAAEPIDFQMVYDKFARNLYMLKRGVKK